MEIFPFPISFRIFTIQNKINMTKQEQINALIAKPIQLGDKVNVRIPYEKLTSVKVGRK